MTCWALMSSSVKLKIYSSVRNYFKVIERQRSVSTVIFIVTQNCSSIEWFFTVKSPFSAINYLPPVYSTLYRIFFAGKRVSFGRNHPFFWKRYIWIESSYFLSKSSFLLFESGLWIKNSNFYKKIRILVRNRFFRSENFDSKIQICSSKSEIFRPHSSNWFWIDLME